MSKELAITTDAEFNNVLRNSLYPSASDISLELVKGYCKVAGLDIMLKPVHIVPIWNSAVGKMVDVIMPGIGLYRTTAARTKQYAGISEPIFGPTVTRKIGNNEYSYPEWCKVTVKRKFDDTLAEFTAQEYWIENYAVRGGKEKSIEPNAMWSKRPFGQLKKCAEAQALRMAFPEVGEQQTADEMEGKEIEEKIINPLPTDTKKADINAILESIKTMEVSDFTTIDPTILTPDEQKLVSAAFKARKKEIIESKVVADIKPTTEAKQRNKAVATDWQQLISDATTKDEVNAIWESIPEELRQDIQDAYAIKMDLFR
jgi:phage recombination protein Bet